MFVGCRKNVETPEPGNEPTATALTTPTASAGETEPDVFPDAEETPENGTADTPTKAPNVTPAGGGQNPADTPGVTTAPGVTAAPGTEVTPTPNGGVEMPRIPLG